MPRAPRPLTVILTSEEQEILREAWNGGGGFQDTLAANLVAKLSPAGELALSDEEVGEVIRHMSYVQSGFRDRVRTIFKRSFTEVMNRK